MQRPEKISCRSNYVKIAESKQGKSMHRALVILILTIYLATPPYAKDASTTLPLNQFIQKTNTEGRKTYIPKIIANLIDMPADIGSKSILVTKDQTTDKMTHIFEVAFEVSRTSTTQPFGLAWSTDYSWPGNNEAYYFRTDTTGVLVKALIIHGKRDAEGKPVRGAGTVAVKDIHSPEIQERFQHELDFWLKNAYRKKR